MGIRGGGYPQNGEEQSDMRPHTEKFSDSLTRLFQENDDNASHKSAEQNHIDLATHFYRALGENDLDTAKACLSPNVFHKLHGPEDFEPSGEDLGPDAMLEHMAAVFSLLDGQTPRALRVIAQGNSMTIFYEDSGRIKNSGKEYCVSGVHLIEFHEQKIVRFENLFDTASFERALSCSKAMATS